MRTPVSSHDQRSLSHRPRQRRRPHGTVFRPSRHKLGSSDAPNKREGRHQHVAVVGGGRRGFPQARVARNIEACLRKHLALRQVPPQHCQSPPGFRCTEFGSVCASQLVALLIVCDICHARSCISRGCSPAIVDIDSTEYC